MKLARNLEMFISILCILCLELSKCNPRKTHVKMETMVQRTGFEVIHKADAETDHEIVIAICQRNLDILEEEVLERSNPGL